MKRIPNRPNLFVGCAHDKEFWLDDRECLQPCPVCDEDGARNATLIIAHHLCWATMPRERRNHFSELRERLMLEVERELDRLDRDDDD